MLETYGFVGLFIIVAVGFAAIMILLPVALRFLKVVPHHPGRVKNTTFECGMETIGKTWVQFNVHYYFYALLFVALDVIVLFLYPWATQIRQLGFDGLFVILGFIGIILVAYLYAWKKGAFAWK